MSTDSVPSSKQSQEGLRDWFKHNPHQGGRLRLVLFGLGLIALGLLGVRWAAPASPTVYNAAGQCSYGAERYEPPPLALPVVVSQTFVIQWTIQNTGSCHKWSNDVFFVRRNDDIASAANTYPVSSQPLVTATESANPVIVAYVTTEMIAPPTPGEYVTEWHMQTSNLQRFGLIMRQRVQVVDAAEFSAAACVQ